MRALIRTTADSTFVFTADEDNDPASTVWPAIQRGESITGHWKGRRRTVSIIFNPAHIVFVVNAPD